MTGRFDKYGELKRRSILRKARINNGRLKNETKIYSLDLRKGSTMKDWWPK